MSEQRLEIVYLGNLVTGQPAPLTGVAHYWEISIKACEDTLYVVAVGQDAEGNFTDEHVVPLALVRSVSARSFEPAVSGGTPEPTDG